MLWDTDYRKWSSIILSLAVGNEMPILVNLGHMLDIFASVLTLGIFFK
jgi:hydrogenase-4 component E